MEAELAVIILKKDFNELLSIKKCYVIFKIISFVLLCLYIGFKGTIFYFASFSFAVLIVIAFFSLPSCGCYKRMDVVIK